MITKKSVINGLAALLFFPLASLPVTAGVMINKTRIIYNQKDKSANATLSNITADNYAVQVWVNGTSDRSDEQVPFVATPALSRIGPGEEQIIKVINLPDNAMPKDRESVFYFNAQEIPALKKGASENQLTIAIRSRIKLFYRPAGLAGSPDDALKHLNWQRIERDGKPWLRVTNTSPWHVSFSTLRFVSNGHTADVEDPAMLAPFSHSDYALPGHNVSTRGRISYSVINDYGAIKLQPEVSLP